MKLLVKLCIESGALLWPSQHITVSFVPGRVVHFGYDEFQLTLILTKAVVTGNGIHNMSEITKICQQIDGPRVTHTLLFEYSASNFLNQWYRRITQKIAAAELRQGRPSGRPKRFI